MTLFNLQLISNEQTFKYTFPEKFLNKNYKLGLIKLDGDLEIENKNDLKQTLDVNNNPIHKIETNFTIPPIDNIFLKCNLIEDSYVNENRLNSIYRFRFDEDEIIEEPRQIIYHKVTKNPKEIILKLVDVNNNLINASNVDLWIDSHLKEI